MHFTTQTGHGLGMGRTCTWIKFKTPIFAECCILFWENFAVSCTFQKDRKNNVGNRTDWFWASWTLLSSLIDSEKSTLQWINTDMRNPARSSWAVITGKHRGRHVIHTKMTLTKTHLSLLGHRTGSKHGNRCERHWTKERSRPTATAKGRFWGHCFY